jgi:putative ABC transport system ATP-binding protein
MTLEIQVTVEHNGRGGASLIRMKGVSKRYEHASESAPALADVNLTVRAGECIAVVGRSGSGKTTLVNILTGIDSPSEGEIDVADDRIHLMSQEQLAVWRGRSVGIVFQFFQLLPTLTVLENVALAMEFAGRGTPGSRRQRAFDLLERLGVADQALKLPPDLSGGQQQRAAIARALANDPPIIVADEPTGNLDSVTSDAVLELLASLAREGKTVLAVTHEQDVSRFFTRTISLRDGRIAADTARADVRA